MNDFKEDCVHLHACRRLCKMHDIRNRGCNDSCTAYCENNHEAKEKLSRYIYNVLCEIDDEYEASQYIKNKMDELIKD